MTFVEKSGGGMFPPPCKGGRGDLSMTNPNNLHKEKILILDFGSQYTQNIARKVRELNVYSEIHPFCMPLDEIRKFNPKGIILSGGPASILEKNSPVCDPAIFDLLFHRQRPAPHRRKEKSGNYFPRKFSY